MSNTKNYVGERIAGAQSAARKRRTALLSELRSTYLMTHRDDELREQFELLLDESIAVVGGKRVPGRSLTVVGGSGAGKSMSIRTLLTEKKELAPFETEIGILMPIISMNAPAPYSLKRLGQDLLRRMGVEPKRHLASQDVWSMVRHQLKLHQTHILHIDELQHVLPKTDGTGTNNVRDTLKDCMNGDDTDWPVSLLLSGLPSILDFVDEEKTWQQERRHKTMHFPTLTFPEDAGVVEHIIDRIACNAAGLKAKGLGKHEFLHQLAYAGRYEFGRVVDLVIYACVNAVDGRQKHLGIEHFSKAYSDQYACDPELNIFEATKWHEIEPGTPKPRDRFAGGISVVDGRMRSKKAA